MILALARPRARLSGASTHHRERSEGWVPKKPADRSHRAGKHRAKPADGYGPRPAPVFAAPARPHASLHPFGPCPHLVIRSVVPLPSFAHSAGRTLVRSSAHSNIRSSAHRSFARSLARSYVARFVRSSPARFSLLGFLSFIARSLALVSVRSLARSLVRSFAHS